MQTNRYLRRLLALFVVGAAVLLVVVIGRNRVGKQPALVTRQPFLPKGVDLSLHQIHFSESQGNSRKWELFAASAAYDKTADVSRLEKIRFVVARGQHFGSLVVIADRGEYYHASKDVLLVGNVQAEGEKGFHFEAGQVHYRASQSSLATPGPVRLSNGPLRVTGVGLELSTDTGQAHILHQVEADIVPARR